MPKFAVSPEGAEALRKLAADVRSLMDQMSLCGRSLQNTIMSHEEGLGGFADEAIVLAGSCVAAVAAASSSADVIARSLESKAATIESLVGDVTAGAGGISGNTYSSKILDPMRPVRGASPRRPEKTQYGWKANEDGFIYDHPFEMASYLCDSQGSAYSANFTGTCGLCSCANVLRLAGVDLGEKEMIDFAAPGKLCDYKDGEPAASGGTGPWERREILSHFGADSDIVPVDMSGGQATSDSVQRIADYVSDGRGVIISVHANTLYASGPAEDDYHAVVVTSVRKDGFGNTTGFYIADSNIGTTYYPASLLQKALTGNPMNVTAGSVR